MIVILVLLGLFFIIALLSFFNRRKVLSAFANGNVVVTGSRGKGKDLLFSFVINSQIKQRNKAVGKMKKGTRRYISNIDYTNGRNYIEFDPTVMNIGGNTYDNFISDKFKRYKYPYEDNVDYFLSDGGVYFPAQYHSMLDKKYSSMPLFQAISRHLGNCNFHVNVQNLNRLWDKIREQSDTYIRCTFAKVLFKRIAIQTLYIYDNYESCLARRPPFPKLLMMGKEGRMRLAEYESRNGHITKVTIVHTLKHRYDDRIFKEKLERGVYLD